MSALVIIAVCLIGWGLFVYVIIRLLEENRRLTAAAIAPRPEQAVAQLRTPQAKRERADERFEPLVGA